MDDHALEVLEYAELRRLVLAACPGELSRQVVRRMRPSTRADRLRVSLAQLDEARHLLDTGRPLPVHGLGDMLAVVARAHAVGRALEPSELLRVADVLRACASLRGFLAELQESAPELAALGRRMADHEGLHAEIARVVDPPDGVAEEASPRLCELRRRRRLLEDGIRERMTTLASGPRYRPYLRDRTFSVRNGRYVLAVILDKKGHVPGILHDKSATGNTAFVEPQEIAVHASELEDVRLDEQREVSRILLELSRRIFDAQDELGRTQELAAWLEFTAARAALSVTLGCQAAEIAREPVIRLREARHPLLEAAARGGSLDHDVVPCSVELGGDARMLVITGPNTGGKTVALKTVGLIQLMFQSGLHVPAAAGTSLPVLSGIFADIGDEQSLSQNLSTFSGHVRNIAGILEKLGPGVLVLLDELGAGTDPSEGSALGQAILDELHQAGALAMVTTHMTMLKSYGFTRRGVENACVTFDARTLAPTYRLLVGQPGRSNALAIARRHGIPGSVVERAEGLVEGEAQEVSELMDQLVAKRLETEQSRLRSQEMVAQSRKKLDEAHEALDEAASARDRVEQEAENEVTRILQEFAAAARTHLNALKNVPKALKGDVEALEELARKRLRMTPFAARRRDFIRDLKRHDQVYIPRFNQVCRVEKLHRADERLLVRVGGLSMEVGFDDVSWVTPPDAS